MASSVLTFAGFIARGFEVFTRSAREARDDWRSIDQEQQRRFEGTRPPIVGATATPEKPTTSSEREREREPKGPNTPRA
jgi:hypothetical protein